MCVLLESLFLTKCHFPHLLGCQLRFHQDGLAPRASTGTISFNGILAATLGYNFHSFCADEGTEVQRGAERLSDLSEVTQLLGEGTRGTFS